MQSPDSSCLTDYIITATSSLQRPFRRCRAANLSEKPAKCNKKSPGCQSPCFTKSGFRNHRQICRGEVRHKYEFRVHCGAKCKCFCISVPPLFSSRAIRAALSPDFVDSFPCTRPNMLGHPRYYTEDKPFSFQRVLPFCSLLIERTSQEPPLTDNMLTGGQRQIRQAGDGGL